MTVGAYYKRAWDEQVAPTVPGWRTGPRYEPGAISATARRGGILAAHIHEPPVWIVPCLEGGHRPLIRLVHLSCCSEHSAGGERARPWRDIDQLYLSFEKEAKAALGLPPGVHSYALLPIGYPMGRFGPVRRIALADVVYENRWGQPYRD